MTTTTHNIPLANPNATESYKRGKINVVINFGNCITRYFLGVVRKGDEGRKEYQGPLVPGPWAYAGAMCGFIDNHGGSKAESERRMGEGTEITVESGDCLVIDGETYTISHQRNRWNSDWGVELERVVQPVTMGEQTALDFASPEPTELVLGDLAKAVAPKRTKAAKAVTSKDPRKPAIMAAFKRLHDCTRVTLVKERADGSFEANCMVSAGRRRGYDSLGTKTIAADEVAK